MCHDLMSNQEVIPEVILNERRCTNMGTILDATVTHLLAGAIAATAARENLL